MMNSRTKLLLIAVSLIVLVAIGCDKIKDIAEDKVTSTTDDRLSEPIVEGESIAGLKIGDDEKAIYSLLLEAELEVNYAGNDKYAGMRRISFYKGDIFVEGGAFFSAYIKDNKIVIIELHLIPFDGKVFYTGKTTKGFTLGDSLEELENLYGEPYWKLGSMLWYKDLGVMFSPTYRGEGVSSVIITSPGYDLSDFLRRRGVPIDEPIE